MVIKRFDVWLVQLSPTTGSELKKTRPCLIVSPNVVNDNLETVIIVPLTSTIKNYPSRVNCVFHGKKGQLVIDQIRTIDKSRLKKRLGVVEKPTSLKVLRVISELFSE